MLQQDLSPSHPTQGLIAHCRVPRQLTNVNEVSLTACKVYDSGNRALSVWSTRPSVRPFSCSSSPVLHMPLTIVLLHHLTRKSAPRHADVLDEASDGHTLVQQALHDLARPVAPLIVLAVVSFEKDCSSAYVVSSLNPNRSDIRYEGTRHTERPRCAPLIAQSLRSGRMTRTHIHTQNQVNAHSMTFADEKPPSRLAQVRDDVRPATNVRNPAESPMPVKMRSKVSGSRCCIASYTGASTKVSLSPPAALPAKLRAVLTEWLENTLPTIGAKTRSSCRDVHPCRSPC